MMEKVKDVILKFRQINKFNKIINFVLIPVDLSAKKTLNSFRKTSVFKAWTKQGTKGFKKNELVSGVDQRGYEPNVRNVSVIF
jgi:hypothetical protein